MENMELLKQQIEVLQKQLNESFKKYTDFEVHVKSVMEKNVDYENKLVELESKLKRSEDENVIYRNILPKTMGAIIDSDNGDGDDLMDELYKEKEGE